MIDHRRAAIDALNEAIAHRPRKHDAAFAEAVEQVCRLRDELTASGDRAGLDWINGVLSLVFAGCFPLDQVPWIEVVGARDALGTFSDR